MRMDRAMSESFEEGSRIFPFLVLTCALFGAPTAVRAFQAQPVEAQDIDSETKSRWTIPEYADVRGRMLRWIAARPAISEEQQAVVEKLWPVEKSPASADEVWETAIVTFSRLDPETDRFLKQLAEGAAHPNRVEPGLLYEAERGDFYLANVRLHYVRWLSQREYVEPALELIQQINSNEVISPAAYLYYKATCERRLLQREAGLKTIDQLLSLPESDPQRYWQLAKLLKQEWGAVEENSLEEVSMLMDDIHRRLKLAQPGQKTQNVEDQAVKLLDEIIKKLEESQNQDQSGASGRNSNRRADTPAGDSRIHGSKAPGEVDPKTTKGGANWGNMNAKQRAEVENLISRDFPAHYRKTIEEYFKKLATRRPSGDLNK